MYLLHHTIYSIEFRDTLNIISISELDYGFPYFSHPATTHNRIPYPIHNIKNIADISCPPYMMTYEHYNNRIAHSLSYRPMPYGKYSLHIDDYYVCAVMVNRIFSRTVHLINVYFRIIVMNNNAHP